MVAIMSIVKGHPHVRISYQVFWPDFVAVWSKCILRLSECEDKCRNLAGIWPDSGQNLSTHTAVWMGLYIARYVQHLHFVAVSSGAWKPYTSCPPRSWSRQWSGRSKANTHPPNEPRLSVKKKIVIGATNSAYYRDVPFIVNILWKTL